MSRRDTTSNNNSETSSTHSAMLNSKRSREVEPFQSRMEKIQKIKNNFSRMDQIFKKEEVRRLFDSLGKFSFEEYSKFFQNVANHEFLSLNVHQAKAKEPITIEQSFINYDPTSFLSISNPATNISNNAIENINQIIVQNTKEKNISIDNKADNKDVIMNDTVTLSPKDYLESITKNIKTLTSSSTFISLNNFRQIIKLYSSFIHSNDDISIELEQEGNKNLRTLIISKKTKDNSLEDFCYLCNYWLYTEYLYTSSTQSQNQYLYNRYNRLLDDIVSLIESSNLSTTDESIATLFTSFISSIPQYNSQSIDLIINYHNNFFKDNYAALKQKSKDKIALINQLPYLSPMKKIYLYIVYNQKCSLSEKEREASREKLLTCFINMTMNDYNHLNARAIEFLFTEIYDITKDTEQYEEKAIKKIAIERLKELSDLKEDDNKEENKNYIEKRFPLYLHLCGKDIEVIKEFPDVYSTCVPIVKSIFNKYMKLLMKTLDKFNAENLIAKCDDKTEEIVICVIKAIYSQKGNFNITEKLFRNIRMYYTKYFPSSINGAMELCDKIPLSDFYTENNFVIDKIKGNEEEAGEIMNKINSNSNEWLFSEFGVMVKNKAIFYILYYYRYIYSKNILFEELLKKFIFFFNKELIKLPDEEHLQEKKSLFILFASYLKGEQFISMIDNILTYLENKDDKIYEFYIESISQCLNSNNSLDDKDFDAIVSFAKNRQSDSIKEKVIRNFDERIKNELRGKDLILFSDL